MHTSTRHTCAPSDQKNSCDVCRSALTLSQCFHHAPRRVPTTKMFSTSSAHSDCNIRNIISFKNENFQHKCNTSMSYHSTRFIMIRHARTRFARANLKACFSQLYISSRSFSFPLPFVKYHNYVTDFEAKYLHEFIFALVTSRFSSAEPT